jgi:hypothetical protein
MKKACLQYSTNVCLSTVSLRFLICMIRLVDNLLTPLYLSLPICCVQTELENDEHIHVCSFLMWLKRKHVKWRRLKVDIEGL